MTTIGRYFLCGLLFGSSLFADSRKSLLENRDWQHIGTEGDSARLQPKKGEAWSEGWIHFTDPIEIDRSGLALTFNVQTDRTRGEDVGAVYAKLQFTNDASRREQVSINATTRPSDRWYMLYVDPGWQLPNRHYLEVEPPFGLFPTPEAIERFRLIVRRDGDSLVATLSHWNAKEERWSRLTTKDGQNQMAASIADDLERQISVKSLSFQFPGDISVVSKITLEAGNGESVGRLATKMRK
jgi:hypothetical protein